VALVALGDADAIVLPELVGPHTAWRSLTPMALTRHAKRRGGRIVDGAEEQVVRELTLRGFPAPAEVELLPGAWMRFQTTRPGTARRGAPTVVGVRLRFADPVRGPIALGGLSHFGLGLFTAERG
jgi:CRISPR-associated protein Csb2